MTPPPTLAGFLSFGFLLSSVGLLLRNCQVAEIELVSMHIKIFKFLIPEVVILLVVICQ